MDTAALIDWLNEYTEHELFYKQHYESKKDDEAFNNFIKNIDINFVKEKNILIPECSFLPTYMPDDWLAAGEVDIALFKHYRYTPSFFHRHAFFEMFYVFSGSCSQEISGNKVQFSKGDLCILSPNTKHSISVFDDSIVINVLIRKSTFNESFFELLTGRNILSIFFTEILYDDNRKNYLTFHTGNDEKLKNVLLDMLNEFISKNKYSKKLANALLIVFFAYLLQNHESSVEAPLQVKEESNLIAQILTYIEDNYSTVTLEELCTIFHFSTAYLSKLIKISTGLNFTDIIKNIKIKRACVMLKSTNISIRDISEAIGYSSQEHFIRTFKKNISMSPTQYRKENTMKI